GLPNVGTDVELSGTGNVVYAAPGTTVTGAMGGNTVQEAFSDAQANAYLAAGSQDYYSSNGSALQAFFAQQQPRQQLFGDSGVQQNLVLTSSQVQNLLTSNPQVQNLLA